MVDAMVKVPRQGGVFGLESVAAPLVASPDQNRCPGTARAQHTKIVSCCKYFSVTTEDRLDFQRNGTVNARDHHPRLTL